MRVSAERFILAIRGLAATEKKYLLLNCIVAPEHRFRRKPGGTVRVGRRGDTEAR
jgi:hypothetical protein